MRAVTKTISAIALTIASISLSPAYADGELTGTSFYVSVDPTNPPFATLDKDYLTPVGLDVDIIMELKKRLGFKLVDERIFPILRNEQMKRIKEYRLDIIGGCLSATKAREKFMDFTPVYFDTGLTMIYSRSRYSNVEDLNPFTHGRIAAVEGSVAVDFIQEQLPKAQMVTVPSFMVGIVAVAQGKLDGMIYDRPIIEYFAKSMPSFNLAIIDKEYERQFSQIALGIQKYSPYGFFISRELEEMQKDGTLDTLIKKYFP